MAVSTNKNILITPGSYSGLSTAVSQIDLKWQESGIGTFVFTPNADDIRSTVYNWIDNEEPVILLGGMGTVATQRKFVGPYQDFVQSFSGVTSSPMIKFYPLSGKIYTKDIILTGIASFNSIYATGLSTFYSINILENLYDSFNSPGVNGQILQSFGTGIEWIDFSLPTGIITGYGQIHRIPKFNGAYSLTTSIMSESGSVITVGGSINVLGFVTGVAFYGNGLNIDNIDAANITTGNLDSARLTGAYTGINEVGNLNQLNVVGITTSVSFVGEGNQITNLDASKLATGTVDSARVSGSYTGITEVGTLTQLNVSGITTSVNFAGEGNQITNLDASKLATGTVNSDRVSGTYSGITSVGTLTQLNVSGITTSVSFRGEGNQITNLDASKLATGTVNSVRVSGSYTGITEVGSLTQLTVSGLSTFSQAVGIGNSVSYFDSSGILLRSSIDINDIVTNPGGGSGLLQPPGNGIVIQTSPGITTNRQILGTTDQILVINGDGLSGDIILQTPQSIAITTSPTFVDINLTSLSGNNQVVYRNGSSGLAVSSMFNFDGDNLAINGAINSAYKLSVFGSDTSSSNYAIRVAGQTGSDIFYVRNDGVTTNFGQLLATTTLGSSVYAMTVSHTGGTTQRNGLLIETTGTNNSTNALMINVGGISTAMVVDGSGNTGIGRTTVASMRLVTQSNTNTTASEAFRSYDSNGNIIFGIQGNGYIYSGATSTTAKFSIFNTRTEANAGGGLFNAVATQNTSTVRTSYGLNASVQNIGLTTSASQFYGITADVSTSYMAAGATNSASNGLNVAGYFSSTLASNLHAGVFAARAGVYVFHGPTGAASGGGTITNDYGYRLLTSFSGPTAGTITNSYGYFIGATGSTNYPTNLWGFYESYATASGAANFFQNPLLIGTTTKSANLVVQRAHSLAAWGTNGVNLRVTTGTFTDTSTGVGATVLNNAVNSFGGGTLAATNTGVTYTNAYTLYIAAAPASGTNATITNPWSLWVNAGATRLQNTFIGGTQSAWTIASPNTNILAGSGFLGLQIRSNASVLPAIEMHTQSDAIADGGIIGRLSWWAGSATPREVAKIEATVVGTNENAANLRFTTASGGIGTQRMVITSTGLIGIATNTISNTRVHIEGDGAAVRPLYVAGTVSQTANLFQIDATTNGTNYVTVGAAGSVGVGTTLPTQSLHVFRNMRLGGGLFDINNTRGTIGQVLSATAAGVAWTTAGSGTIAGGGAASQIAYFNAPSNIVGYGTFVINGSGFIGIGTANPLSSFHVQGDSRLIGGIRDTNGLLGGAGQVLSSTGAGIAWTNTGGSVSFTGSLLADQIAYGLTTNSIQGSNLFTFNGTNLNIGTTVSLANLTLSGNASISSTLTAFNFIGIGNHISSLNASNVNHGTVPASVLTGEYSGITSVGNLSSLYAAGISTLQSLYLQNSVYDASNSSGISGYLLTSNVSGVLWQDKVSLGIVTGFVEINQVPVGAGSSSIIGYSNLVFMNSSLGINTDFPKSTLDVNGTYNIGSKTVTLSPTNASVLTINMNPNTSCYVKITAHSNINGYGALGYSCDMIIQKGDGTTQYSQPGIILREDNNTSGGVVVAATIVDPGLSALADNMIIQLSVQSDTSESVDSLIVFEVRGEFNTVT